MFSSEEPPRRPKTEGGGGGGGEEGELRALVAIDVAARRFATALNWFFGRYSKRRRAITRQIGFQFPTRRLHISIVNASVTIR